MTDRLPFLDERAKARAVLAVKAFEAQTCAELVVTVKKQARTYQEAHLLMGAVLAFLVLVFLLYFPWDFNTALMPLDTAIAFAAGYLLSRWLPPLQRLALTEARRRQSVEPAAKAAFVDLGVTRTSGRTGVLVYVAMLEGMVSVVADAGVTPEAQAAAQSARVTLEAALGRLDIGAFAAALESLGAAFAPTMPRAHDDVNELPDEVA
ncbi:MAG: hypothetical protein JWP97_5686 [Labilithrix sp.]|nr:hypothetical protein [Labilithrix sp.]